MRATAVRRIGAGLQSTGSSYGSMLSVPELGRTARRARPSTWRKSLVMPELAPTPLLTIGSNLHAKLEGQHEGGSVKDRAVTKCVFGMLQSGLLQPGGTLALCTSGSAGVSLLRAQRLLEEQGVEIQVKIFMPESYVPKSVPQVIVGTEGVVVERSSPELPLPRSLCPIEADFITTLAHMKQLAAEHNWAILDQHYDVNSMLAHESTALELVRQLPSVTDVVCTTGTGGTAAGLREFLPRGVTVHARPAVSGTLDGCTDVRRYSNFCNADLLEGYTSEFFCPQEAREAADEMKAKFQVESGPSSGACYALAKKVLAAKPNAQIAFICADGRQAASVQDWNSPMKGLVPREGGSPRRRFAE